MFGWQRYVGICSVGFGPTRRYIPTRMVYSKPWTPTAKCARGSSIADDNDVHDAVRIGMNRTYISYLMSFHIG